MSSSSKSKKQPAGVKPAAGSAGAAFTAQVAKLDAVSTALRQDVNQILKKHGIDLELESLTLTAKKEGPALFIRCCIINGEFVCGPQCG